MSVLGLPGNVEKRMESDINRKQEVRSVRRVIALEQSAVIQLEGGWSWASDRAARGRGRHGAQWTGRAAPWWAPRTPQTLSGEIYGPRTRTQGPC